MRQMCSLILILVLCTNMVGCGSMPTKRSEPFTIEKVRDNLNEQTDKLVAPFIVKNLPGTKGKVVIGGEEYSTDVLSQYYLDSGYLTEKQRNRWRWLWVPLGVACLAGSVYCWKENARLEATYGDTGIGPFSMAIYALILDLYGGLSLFVAKGRPSIGYSRDFNKRLNLRITKEKEENFGH